ncbi:transposase [Aliarcobacter butzleri]|uniref:transposase n=1 Tax=Aliarcobacter butzleri TaxID=28197 RepID=UPI0021B1F255|nr:transposase [Aliarcobacter butzleri]MCT7635861.1 transposase [Aliarcobacter butzleri]
MEVWFQIVARDIKTIYTAKTEEDAQLALTEFNDIWGSKYPHILQSWLNNWNELATFFLTESASTRNTQNLFKH